MGLAGLRLGKEHIRQQLPQRLIRPDRLETAAGGVRNSRKHQRGRLAGPGDVCSVDRFDTKRPLWPAWLAWAAQDRSELWEELSCVGCDIHFVRKGMHAQSARVCGQEEHVVAEKVEASS